MCGRFTQNYTWEEVYAFLKVFGTPRNLRPHYNIAPTTIVDVIRLDREGRRELVSMRWGLVPYFWKKSLKEVPATFNARAETIAEKPMFRDSFKRRRCIIPASRFFADGSPILAFAGLWDRWIDPATKEELLSCTVIVSGASDWMTPYHDRMPVLLPAQDFDAWLNGSLGADALRPATESVLREWPVSRRVNRTGVGDDDPTIVERVEAA
jgi:putative SOS response-associated peptidase YedK